MTPLCMLIMSDGSHCWERFAVKSTIETGSIKTPVSYSLRTMTSLETCRTLILDSVQSWNPGTVGDEICFLFHRQEGQNICCHTQRSQPMTSWTTGLCHFELIIGSKRHPGSAAKGLQETRERTTGKVQVDVQQTTACYSSCWRRLNNKATFKKDDQTSSKTRSCSGKRNSTTAQLPCGNDKVYKKYSSISKVRGSLNVSIMIQGK
jgi:hypothetical protein